MDGLWPSPGGLSRVGQSPAYASHHCPVFLSHSDRPAYLVLTVFAALTATVWARNRHAVTDFQSSHATFSEWFSSKAIHSVHKKLKNLNELANSTRHSCC